MEAALGRGRGMGSAGAAGRSGGASVDRHGGDAGRRRVDISLAGTSTEKDSRKTNRGELNLALVDTNLERSGDVSGRGDGVGRLGLSRLLFSAGRDGHDVRDVSGSNRRRRSSFLSHGLGSSDRLLGREVKNVVVRERLATRLVLGRRGEVTLDGRQGSLSGDSGEKEELGFGHHGCGTHSVCVK